jgi:hypothetical protein
VTVDAQHYVPLPNKYRVVALHAAVVMTDAGAGQQVPSTISPRSAAASSFAASVNSAFATRTAW